MTKSLNTLGDTGIKLYSPFTSSAKWACFDCRVCFHSWSSSHTRKAAVECRNCKKPMTYAGSAFGAPPRRDVKKWAKYEALIRGGMLFHYFGGNGTVDHLNAKSAAKAMSKRKTRWPHATGASVHGDPDLGKMTHAVRPPGSGKRIERNDRGRDWRAPEHYELPD